MTRTKLTVRRAYEKTCNLPVVNEERVWKKKGSIFQDKTNLVSAKIEKKIFW